MTHVYRYLDWRLGPMHAQLLVWHKIYHVHVTLMYRIVQKSKSAIRILVDMKLAFVGISSSLSVNAKVEPSYI